MVLGLGATVPIHRLLEREAFQPEEVALMGGVFEDVLDTLGPGQSFRCLIIIRSGKREVRRIPNSYPERGLGSCGNPLDFRIISDCRISA
jgi:hypothetical protein